MVRGHPLIVTFSLIVMVLGALALWWLYGSGLSEHTAYKLALESAETYAKRNQIDLNLYIPPTVGTQAGSRVYTFSWRPKEQGGKPLTITVDGQNVDVAVIENPSRGIGDRP